MSLFVKLASLFMQFTILSLLAVGGTSSTLADIHHYLVESKGFMTNAQFSALYAIAQVAPGPNVQFVSLFGWQIAGILGAIVCLLGMCIPSSLLAIYFESKMQQYENTKWLWIIKHGLMPISIGLLIANGIFLSHQADLASWQLYTLTAIIVFLNLTTKVHSLWLMALGAAVGVSGLIG